MLNPWGTFALADPPHPPDPTRRSASGCPGWCNLPRCDPPELRALRPSWASLSHPCSAPPQSPSNPPRPAPCCFFRFALGAPLCGFVRSVLSQANPFFSFPLHPQHHPLRRSFLDDVARTRTSSPRLADPTQRISVSSRPTFATWKNDPPEGQP
jgi:hypothetical protein